MQTSSDFSFIPGFMLSHAPYLKNSWHSWSSLIQKQNKINPEIQLAIYWSKILQSRSLSVYKGKKWRVLILVFPCKSRFSSFDVASISQCIFVIWIWTYLSFLSVRVRRKGIYGWNRPLNYVLLNFILSSWTAGFLLKQLSSKCPEHNELCALLTSSPTKSARRCWTN